MPFRLVAIGPDRRMETLGIDIELLSLWIALVAYTMAGVAAVIGLVLRWRLEKMVLAALVLGLLLQTLFFTLRWDRLGHGPFNSMFEILASNIWSLLLVYTVAFAKIRELRPTAAFVLPVIFMMMGWMLMSSKHDTVIPPTFDTIWLYIHIGLGKIFLGSMLVALGLGFAILSRRFERPRDWLKSLPTNESLDNLAYRFMVLALIFDSLMLVAGSIWAKDAWGRYWGWDPLETWAFITWLLLGLAIHFRLTLKTSPAAGALLIIAVFCAAFVTFFGIPYVSSAPHQGMM